jgi:ankyrin repeat protein
LSYAAQDGKLPMMRALIAAGASVDGVAGGDSPLYGAASNDKIEAVQLLIGAGANVDGANRKGAPLMAAADFGYLDVVQALLNAGADVNGSGPETPLQVAREQGHAAVAALLKERGGHV